MIKLSSKLQKYARKRTGRVPSGYLHITAVVVVIFGIWMILTLWDRYRNYRITYQSLRCGTCALVANSGHTIGSAAGPDIDGKDCVFRINNAPTRHFEDIVGSKTTVRVVASETFDAFLCDDRIEGPLDNPLVIYPREKMEFLQEVMAEMSDPSVIYVIDDDALGRFNATFHSSALAAAKGRTAITPDPSTGLIAFLLAMEKCEAQLNVYGVVPPFHCKKFKHMHDAPRDYFPPGDTVSSCPAKLDTFQRYSSAHFLLSETLAVQHLSESSSKIKFHEPSWT